MENKRGSEIFLGVVGVATLIVAIIGATFAFFSASISGDNNVELESYKYSASLTVSRADAATGLKLVPLKDTNIENALKSTDGICKTKDGFAGCALYKLSFTNNGSSAISLNGTLTTNSNAGSDELSANKFENLMVQLLESSDGTNFTTSGSATAVNATVGGTTTLPEVANIANTGTAKDVYLLFYLKDTNAEQSTEMGVTFDGTFTYSSGSSADSGLTADFTIGE